MFIQDLYLSSARWCVRIYHAVNDIFSDEILDDLIDMGLSGRALTEAKQHLWSGMPNQGLTFSRKGRTVMVIGFTSDGGNYWNTIDHERMHLLQHISKERGIDPYGEDIAYISGEFTQKVYECARHLLCNCERDCICG